MYVCSFLYNYKISVLTQLISRNLCVKITLGLHNVLFSLFYKNLDLPAKLVSSSIFHHPLMKVYAWTGKITIKVNQQSTNQPTNHYLKNFIKEIERKWLLTAHSQKVTTLETKLVEQSKIQTPPSKKSSVYYNVKDRYKKISFHFSFIKLNGGKIYFSHIKLCNTFANCSGRMPPWNIWDLLFEAFTNHFPQNRLSFSCLTLQQYPIHICIMIITLILYSFLWTSTLWS